MTKHVDVGIVQSFKPDSSSGICDQYLNPRREFIYRNRSELNW